MDGLPVTAPPWETGSVKAVPSSRVPRETHLLDPCPLPPLSLIAFPVTQERRAAGTRTTLQCTRDVIEQFPPALYYHRDSFCVRPVAKAFPTTRSSVRISIRFPRSFFFFYYFFNRIVWHSVIGSALQRPRSSRRVFVGDGTLFIFFFFFCQKSHLHTLRV